MLHETKGLDSDDRECIIREVVDDETGKCVHREIEFLDTGEIVDIF